MSQTIQRYRVGLKQSRHFDGSTSGCLVRLEMPEDAHILALRCIDHILHLVVQCDLDRATRAFGLYLTGAAQALPHGLGPYLASFRDADAGELHAFLVSGQDPLMEALT